MSQSSKLPMDNNIFSALSATTGDEKVNSIAAEKVTKRRAPSPPADAVKRVKAGCHSPTNSAPTNATKTTEYPKFVSAADIVASSVRPGIQMMPEISDEELLAMAIKFEKEHPQ